MSEIKVNSVVNSTGDNDSGLDLSTNDNIKFKIANSQKAIIDASGNVGIGTSSPSHELHITGSSDTRAIITSGGSGDAVMMFENASGNTWGHGLDLSSGNYVIGYNASGDPSLTSDGKVNIDTSGNVLVGTTDSNPNNNSADSTADNGIALLPSGLISIATHQNATMVLNRTGNDGNLMDLRRSGSTVGSVGILGDRVYLAVSGHGVALDASGNSFLPSTDSGGNQDNFVDIGASSARFDDIFATNTSITDSDENKKQNIAPLTSAEINAATAISKLFKTFKWKDKVVEKGSNARIHTGVIAQQVQTAMSDVGLDASKYAFWCSDTYWEKDNFTYNTEEEAPKDASKITRLSLRYVELLAFIGAATEQRLASIEARLTALESK